MNIVICEKNSQRKNIIKAVGDQYGEVYALSGHVLGFKMPEEISLDLKKWGYDLIKPAGKKIIDDKSSCFEKVKKAIEKATNVIVASDCDREGTLLVREVLDFCDYKGTAQRAIFTAEDVKTLQDSFKKLKPLSTTDNEYKAGMGRETADYILGLTMTRAISVSLGQKINIGRVKTPTFAIVVKRELDILNFKPQNYYGMKLFVNGVELVHLQKDPLITNPKDYNDFIENRPNSCDIRKEIKPGKESAPQPYDLLSLTKAMDGYTAKRVLEIAQDLYSKHKITTYPRSESRNLPTNMIEDCKAVYNRLQPLYNVPNSCVIHEGKSRTFYDSDKSHHAIIPNPNADIKAIYSKLDNDEKKAFDLISRRFIASMLEDALIEKTIYETEINGYLFRKSGKVYKSLGWLSFIGCKDPSILADLPQGKNDIDKIELSEHVTTPPKRFTESGLGDAMFNAWRFVDDEKYIEQLKESEGVGTQATRAEIVESLKNIGILKNDGKYIVPTKQAIELFKIINDLIPALVDPGITAKWDLALKMVEAGELTFDRFIGAVEVRTLEYLELAKNNKNKLTKEPTAKQIMLAKKLVKEHKLPAPDYRDYEALKSFIDSTMGKIKSGELKTSGFNKPTAKQINYAKKLAKDKGIDIPKSALKNGKELSMFIEETKQ